MFDRSTSRARLAGISARRIAWVFAFTILATLAPATAADEADTLVVLDYEFEGDAGDATMLAERTARMARMSDVLRTGVERTDRYRVIDSPRLRSDIERAGTIQYLHRCNGCELDIARAAGGRYVMIPWVFRMSQLVLTMHVEIKDVSTGKLVMKRALDFRNDTDASWAREIEYLVRDMREGKRWN